MRRCLLATVLLPALLPATQARSAVRDWRSQQSASKRRIRARGVDVLRYTGSARRARTVTAPLAAITAAATVADGVRFERAAFGGLCPFRSGRA